jgi:glycosyltransferase involved in cell wall biosynthesis
MNGLLLASSGGTGQSGVYQYIRNLLAHLPDALDPEDALLVYRQNLHFDPAFAKAVERRLTVTTSNNRYERVLAEHLALPLATRRDRIDLLHGPAFVTPRGVKAATVVTFHDLALLRWPDQVPRERHAYLSRAVTRSVRTATRLIAVSNTTKKDMVELLNANPDLIDVIPLGVSPEMKPASSHEISSFRVSYGLTRPFILAVGNLEPRKNLESLIEAFSLVAEELPHDLVLAGSIGWKTEPILQLLRQPHLAGRIYLPGFVERQQLPALYSAADLFVIPSWYEGFGLTLVEAMACGIPAIASNRGSLPEVAGDAALTVDPFPEELGKAILTVLNAPETQDAMIERGLKRAATFTWNRAADMTVESYRRARA